MNIQKYVAFVKVVELGSFTKAAQSLDYTQSGISRMINDLETEWGVSLFERGRAGINLTSDGLKLLPQLKRICNEHEILMTQIEELHDIKTGMIRIGTFSSVATHWLPNMIRIFKKDYPKIDFELLLGDYTEIESWILNGRVDFGFVRLPSKPDLDTIFVEQDRLLVVMPLNHPLANCEKFPIDNLLNSPFMLLEKGAKAEISEIFEMHQISPQVNFTTWDDYAIMSMVENGLGISILPELILKRIPHKIIAKELEIPAFRNIGIATRDQKSLSLASKEFLEYLSYRNIE
ncbi:LysR family transcriptional regulator [Bacillus paralicheniformis]|uniref:LysR family transcriptional regulator n=1 Tax=Bacillus paralicheniformis TaxID=1648923 RepID=UPI00119E8DB0|nr:LysR family transcriptional regulator [Bacillus paralicheniformis]MCY8039807.1 LysR family transcriptional regulator [Bacillus paralicheniformis]MCY8150685.1 LysR family transcriptional regulator [Bacillus paralicheniformis]MCY8179260.1 LysR family transcriptional regulator [Bacillus paralicheniformis]MCY9420381.1 LysR family transcriptional regulator [Bacillus paralicheniformis]MDW6052975.1 LysR family transcriptional regulator [Bacillus paralicheniformis]